MTFWPFYPRKFGALGNSTTDDLAALDACYTAAQNAIQGGESAAIYWEPGAKYGVSGPYYGVKNKHVHLYGRGAVIMALSTFTSASHEGVFQVNASADPSLINLLIQDFTIDINDKNAYGLSCDYASATDTWEIKKSTFRNITVKNNLAGKHCFFFRNLENSVKIENPIVDGWRSTNALPTAAIYCEDRGSGANNGNFYITNPMIGTLSGDVGSPGSYTEGGLGIWIRANGHRINRCYVRGGQLFNWNNHADQGSINCTGVLVDSNDSGAGEKASRTFGIMDLNIEDFKYSIQAKVTGGGSIRNLQARNVSMEYKNPAAESGVRMIEIGTGAISGKLKDLFCMTQVNNATAVH
ncbi:MAG: hypothetical protein ACREBU_05020, partial [Nitrososphaera sp.]